MKVRACVARVHPHGCDRRMRGKLAKQAQGEKQTEKRSEERGRKRGRTRLQKKPSLIRSCVGGKRRNQTPQARLFNLHPVTASRFAFTAQHDRRGMVMWAEKESAGKVGTCRAMCVGCSQRMKEERSNKRANQRWSARVYGTGVQILLQKEKEKERQASKASAGRETNREEARRDGEKEEGHDYRKSRV